jgi:hypothetical protein
MLKLPRQFNHVTLLPSLEGILVMIVVIASIGPIEDGDIFWHLKTGQSIVETGEIPRIDSFSFTRTGSPWHAHEWLSDVIFYAMYASGAGFAGLVLLKAIALSLTFLVLFRLASADNGLVLTAFLATLIAGLVSLPSFLVRPQMFTYLFFVLTYAALEAFPRRNYLYLYPIASLVWSYLHGAFIFGHVLFGLFLVYRSLKWLLAGKDRPEESTAESAVVKRMAIIGLLAFSTPLLNHDFFRVYTYSLQYAGQTLHKAYIYEWFPPNFQKEPLIELFLFLSIGTLILLPRQLLLKALILVTPFAHLGLTSARNIPLWAFIMVPFIVEASRARLRSKHPEIEQMNPEEVSFLNRLNQNFTRQNSRASLFLPLILTIAASAFLLTIPPSADYPGEDRWLKQDVFPVEAVHFLMTQPRIQPLFNDYDWGGYLMWRTGWPVFIDGRADLYIPEHFLDYFAAARPGDSRWRQVLDRWQIRTVLIKAQSPLGEVLKATGQWKIVYSDKVAQVLQQNIVN